MPDVDFRSVFCRFAQRRRVAAWSVYFLPVHWKCSTLNLLPDGKADRSHKCAPVHPPSGSFEKALPCQAVECRAALRCGSGQRREETGRRANIAAVAYWVSNNPKLHSPPFFTSESVSRQFNIAVFHHCSSGLLRSEDTGWRGR